MKIINVNSDLEKLDDYFRNVVTRVVCDAYHYVEVASKEDRNNFVKLNIPKEVDDFIKSYIQDSESLLDAYEEAKYNYPSLKETLEKEYIAIYSKYKRINNVLSEEQ